MTVSDSPTVDFDLFSLMVNFLLQLLPFLSKHFFSQLATLCDARMIVRAECVHDVYSGKQSQFSRCGTTVAKNSFTVPNFHALITERRAFGKSACEIFEASIEEGSREI